MRLLREIENPGWNLVKAVLAMSAVVIVSLTVIIFRELPKFILSLAKRFFSEKPITWQWTRKKLKEVG